MRIKKREVVFSKARNGVFLIPILIFLFINILNPVSASLQNNSLGIFYNFSMPNGVGGNPNLIYNGGTGSTGVLTFANGTSANLNSSISNLEIIPYGTGSRLVNAWETNLTGFDSYINTNEFGNFGANPTQLNSSFSFSTWMKGNLTNNEFRRVLSMFNGNTAHDLNFNFTISHDSTGNSRERFYIENAGTNSLLCVYTENIGNKDFYWWSAYHQFGFVYNGSALTSGNIVLLYFDGVQVMNCTNAGGVSGTTNFNISNHLLLNKNINVWSSATNPSEDAYLTDIAYWNYAVDNSTMFNAFQGNQSFITPQPPFLLQGTPFPDAPYFIGTGSKTLDLNNYFAGADSYNITFPIFFDNGTRQMPNAFINQAETNTSTTTVTDGVIVSAVGNGNDVFLTITSNTVAVSEQFTITAINSQGSVVGTFSLNSNVVTGGGTGGTITQGNFFGIFPDASVLSISARVEYIVLTFLAVALLFIGGLSIIFVDSKRNISDGASLGSYLTILFCLIFFIYFVTIGYISIGMLIVITLIALVLCYILFVHRGRGGSGA